MLVAPVIKRSQDWEEKMLDELVEEVVKSNRVDNQVPTSEVPRRHKTCREINSKAASGACQKEEAVEFPRSHAKRQNRILLYLWILFRPGKTPASSIVAIQK